MADGAYVGTQSSVVTEFPVETQRRRSSVASVRRTSAAPARRASVIRVLNVLNGDNAKNPNIKNDASSLASSTDLSDSAFDMKQASGETHAQGGDTRWYKPIDTYEGRHRWDPTADWTEKEEKQIVRKVQARPRHHVVILTASFSLISESVLGVA